MQKKDIIYRQLLLHPNTTQLELAKTLKVSLRVIFQRNIFDKKEEGG